MTQIGKYRIAAELGHGGMADVFLAMVDGPMGTGFTKLACIKRLRPNLAEDPEFVQMLMEEARISARLSHPNVVQTLEVASVGDEHVLALEFLDGQPLHRIHRRAKRAGVELSKTFTYLVLLEALAGLDHAHDLADYDGTPLGIVHRDVTPQNLFVTYDSQVKVVDFGIAKAAGRASETRAGLVKGKVRYMSPEQAGGRPVDRRTDLFAVGIVLWETATGQRFWNQLDDLVISASIIQGQYESSPRAIDPTVPAAIDAICRKALAFSPEDRYATAAELRADLEAALSDETLRVRDLGRIVIGLFEKERAELRAVIERIAKTSVSIAPARLPGLMDSTTSSINSAFVVERSESVAPTSSISGLRKPPPRAGLSPSRAIAIALATVAAAGVFIAVSGSNVDSAETTPRTPRMVSGASGVLVTSELTEVYRAPTPTVVRQWRPAALPNPAQPAGAVGAKPLVPAMPPMPTAAPAPTEPPPEMTSGPHRPRARLDPNLPW